MAGRFLVTVDFSRLTRPTVEKAVRLAHAEGNRIDLLHVVIGVLPSPNLAHPGTQELFSQVNRKEADAARRRLEALAEELVPEHLRGECLLGDGPPAEAICEHAKQGYELAVVSTHGRTGLKHILLGSVAERVVRYSPISVLVVR